MQKEMLDMLERWFQHTPDYILALTPDWKLLWQNRSCPMLSNQADCCRGLGFSPGVQPRRGTYTLCYAGELYSFRLDIAEEPEPFLLVRISETPCLQISWSDPAMRYETENQSAALRSQIFGISNAASALYQMMEETSDQFPALWEEQLSQLNIIRGNCCRLIRNTTLWTEQARYQEMDHISGRPIFLGRELSNFVESSQKILGRAVRLRLLEVPSLFVFANSQRLIQALLCVLLLLHQCMPDMTLVEIEASQQEEQVVLSMSATSVGNDVHSQRHASFQPMYQTSLLSPEEAVLRQFCQTYGVRLLFSNTEERAVYTLRFPSCDKMDDLRVESPGKRFQDEETSIYQIMLADLSEYRFY